MGIFLLWLNFRNRGYYGDLFGPIGSTIYYKKVPYEVISDEGDYLVISDGVVSKFIYRHNAQFLSI